METRGKKVIVLGLGRSGLGAANLLSAAGADVTVADRKSESELAEYTRALSRGVRLSLGGYPERLNGTDLIVVSPGVPLSIDPVSRAKERGIKVIGELELAYRIISNQHSEVSNQKTKFLAITGTNGKSTTTTLVDLMLRKGGFKTMAGGNIGNALTGEILKQVKAKVEERPTPKLNLHFNLDIDFVVAEVSSFQLETVDEFRPSGAAILNMTPDHLDRYRSLSEYIDAKCRVFENQTDGDFLILNADDPATGEIARRVGMQAAKGRELSRIYYFSRRHRVKGAHAADGSIHFDLPGVPSSFTLLPSSFKIKGVHNLENAMASAAMALLAGCNPGAVSEALEEFPGLEHRMEFVKEVDGVGYINDSKGTNVDAVMKSLEGFSQPVILIAGGRDKAGDFGMLRTLVKDKVKALVLIGEAAGKMKAALGDLTKTLTARDLSDAVDHARREATKGDVVLLSPACASFDMFRDFEDRGRQFKRIVREMS